MILSVWLVLVGISLVLITLGLVKPSHSEQAIIGFFFLFLLSFPIATGNLEYETGANVSTTYSYTGDTVDGTTQNIDYQYADFENHSIGYWLGIGSAVGMIGVIVSLRRSYKDNE